MPTAYEELRIAIGRGFYVDNLRTIAGLSLEILKEKKPKHPAIFLVLASVSRWITDAWSDVPLSAQVASRVEGQLKPHVEALLNAADGNSDEVCAALDATADAFREAISRGLDCDMT